MSIYIVVFLIDGNVVPVGKIYYDVEEARAQKEKLTHGDQNYLPTIIEVGANQPPHVVQ